MTPEYITAEDRVPFIETDGRRYRVHGKTKRRPGIDRAPRARVLSDGSIWIIAGRDWSVEGNELVKRGRWPVTRQQIIACINERASLLDNAAKGDEGHPMMTHIVMRGPENEVIGFCVFAARHGLRVEDQGLTVMRLAYDAGRFVDPLDSDLFT